MSMPMIRFNWQCLNNLNPYYYFTYNTGQPTIFLITVTMLISNWQSLKNPGPANYFTESTRLVHWMGHIYLRGERRHSRRQPGMRRRDSTLPTTELECVAIQRTVLCDCRCRMKLTHAHPQIMFWAGLHLWTFRPHSPYLIPNPFFWRV